MLLNVWTQPSGYQFTVTTTSTANITGQIAGYTLIVNSITSGTISVGMVVTGISGPMNGITIISGSGNTWQLNPVYCGPQTIASIPLTLTSTVQGLPFPEQEAVDLALPVHNDDGVAYQVISGELPGGLNIIGNHIKGSPFIVSNLTTYEFCIRASRGLDFADRTFKIAISSTNLPVFITDAGNLPVGPAKQLYALDESYVNYQIEAFDLNTEVGATLKYFISSGDGELPPGLTLSNTGVISGYIQPKLIITPIDGNGNFDEAYYDAGAFDFGITASDGFDTYNYDDLFFDYNQPYAVPKSLNSNYQFRVTLSDGVNYSQRLFRIFVVGNDQFRADSTALDGFVGDMGFTADASFLRTPVWLTNTNLGIYRANNYLTVPIALYDKNLTLFRLETTNAEIYAVAKQVHLSDNRQNGHALTITNANSMPVVGQHLTFDFFLPGATGATYQISAVDDLGDGYYRVFLSTPLLVSIPDFTGFYIGTLGQLPPGMLFDEQTGELYGRVPYQPSITKKYTFSITALRIDATDTEQIRSTKTFNITILGSLTSTITWDSPSALGTIPANYICTLNVSASTNIPDAILLYNLTSGSLPPGLRLNLNGEITGMPNQYYNSSTGELGLTLFHDTDSHGVRYNNQTFDQGKTTIDKIFKFTVTVGDQFEYSAVSKEFTITITAPNTVPYSNITTQPFLAPAQRTAWRSFINNNNVFTPSSIYRLTDPNFGVQPNLNMLVYAGIQTEDAAAYVGAMGLGVKKKRFRFGSVKTATAVDPNTGKSVYEVVYVQMIDPMEIDGKHLPLSITTASVEPRPITVDDSNSIWSIRSDDLNATAPTAIRPEYNITIDSTGYQAGSPNTNEYYPNSITNWQTRLSKVGLSERNYLPLWMRSIPSGSKEQLGYVLCVPLCFCKVGTAEKIVKNIKFSGFDFSTIDYTVDRFTISAVTGYTSDKYLVFRDDRITV
jgi:hypothetical protein